MNMAVEGLMILLGVRLIEIPLIYSVIVLQT
jgi:hypothetical protein